MCPGDDVGRGQRGAAKTNKSQTEKTAISQTRKGGAPEPSEGAYPDKEGPSSRAFGGSLAPQTTCV